MSQPSLPFEIEWLNDQERHHAGLLLTGFIKLCKARGHPLTVLSIERIKHIIITDAQASRLEARLAGMLNRPGERIPGAFINAVISARDRHARAIEAFETAYPAPAAGHPSESECAKTGKTAHRNDHPGGDSDLSPPSHDPIGPVDHPEPIAPSDVLRRLKAEVEGAVPLPFRQAPQSPNPQYPQVAREEKESPPAREKITAMAS